MTSLVELSLKEVADKLKNREITATEVTKACLERIEARNGTINAFVHNTADKALEMAAQCDKRIKEGNARLIGGVPLGIKDIFCTKGDLTTVCSHILDGFRPPYESTVTENLWKSGAVMLGKTNMDEFAMGSSNETSYYGLCRNPWNTDCVPGGSSGGSAAAVADYQCYGATGTDTGGSIRQPAAFNGIVGMKPTYGRCSRYGVVAFASSLDQAGPMARTVEDTALMLRCMSGYDPMDSTSADLPIEAYDEGLADLDLKGLKIGLPKEYFMEGLDPSIAALIKDAVKRFEEKGATVKEISLPHTDAAVATYYVIAPAEAAANLSRYDGMRYGLRVEGENLTDTYESTRSEGFGWEVKRRIMIGNYVLSSGYYDAYYTKAQKVRTLISQDFKNAFKEVDVIFAPTTPTTAFKIGENSDDPVQMYMNDVFTLPASLAGLPAISVPAGLVEGMPAGLQIIGPAFEDKKVLQVAYAHEQMCGFELKKPE